MPPRPAVLAPALASVLVLALALPAAPPASAQASPPPARVPAAAPAIAAERPWARATTGTGGNGAGYVTLRNAGPEPARLVAATSPAARAVELHTHAMEQGVMRMRQVESIELPPGAPVALAPGGLHLMLIGLAAPLRQGERVPVTLRFADGSRVTVELRVQAAGAAGPAGDAAAHPPGAHRH